MNYTEVTQAIQDYTENTETSFVTNIPTFVRQAEEKILRQVLIPELRKAATGSTVANSVSCKTKRYDCCVFYSHTGW